MFELIVRALGWSLFQIIGMSWNELSSQLQPRLNVERSLVYQSNNTKICHPFTYIIHSNELLEIPRCLLRLAFHAKVLKYFRGLPCFRNNLTGKFSACLYFTVSTSWENYASKVTSTSTFHERTLLRYPTAVKNARANGCQLLSPYSVILISWWNLIHFNFVKSTQLGVMILYLYIYWLMVGMPMRAKNNRISGSGIGGKGKHK